FGLGGCGGCRGLGGLRRLGGLERLGGCGGCRGVGGLERLGGGAGFGGGVGGRGGRGGLGGLHDEAGVRREAEGGFGDRRERPRRAAGQGRVPDRARVSRDEEAADAWGKGGEGGASERESESAAGNLGGASPEVVPRGGRGT